MTIRSVPFVIQPDDRHSETSEQENQRKDPFPYGPGQEPVAEEEEEEGRDDRYERKKEREKTHYHQTK